MKEEPKQMMQRNRKEEMIAALECRQSTGLIPLWELEFQLWDKFSGKHMVLGREFESLSAGQQEKALHENAEAILAVCNHLGFSAVSTPAPFWEQAPGQLAYYVLPESARFRQVEILRQLADDDLMLIGNVGGVLGADYREEFCVALFESPEKIDAQARQCLANGLVAARKFCDAGGDAVTSPSDIADNSGPFFKKDHMQRFILPYLDRWATECQAMGLYTILHTDGFLPPPYLKEIAETSVHALQAIDPVAGMNMAATKALVGNQLCLCGNVDCGLLVSGDPGEVYAAATELLNSCKNSNGFVLGSSNAVQREAPAENYSAFISAWKAHSK